jgi:hypothetical protein
MSVKRLTFRGIHGFMSQNKEDISVEEILNPKNEIILRLRFNRKEILSVQRC